MVSAFTPSNKYSIFTSTQKNMEQIAENIKGFFQTFTQDEITYFEKLPKSGGDRIYFRITTEEKSYIATFNENIKENIAFLNFTSPIKDGTCAFA